MYKTVMLTGATDGIGLEASKLLFAQGHTLLIHGRNPSKLKGTVKAISGEDESPRISVYCADLSNLDEVNRLINEVKRAHKQLDVLINNAGVLKTDAVGTPLGIDVRFVVNTIAPYLLTRSLLALIPPGGRIVNLSSAAQHPVSLAALKGEEGGLEAFEAYAQSKLAITMWTNAMSQHESEGRIHTSVNPGSLLATKMVKEGFGMPGNDIQIGAKILTDAAVSAQFNSANGKYYDNDSRAFADPHVDALDSKKNAALVIELDNILNR